MNAIAERMALGSRVNFARQMLTAPALILCMARDYYSSLLQGLAPLVMKISSLQDLNAIFDLAQLRIRALITCNSKYVCSTLRTIKTIFRILKFASGKFAFYTRCAGELSSQPSGSFTFRDYTINSKHQLVCRENMKQKIHA